MSQVTHTPTTLHCTLQPDHALSPEHCLNGILTQTADGFLFEETIRKGRPPRNPKLFDGRYLSLVRMQNGRYQMHIKTMDPDIDPKELSIGICHEVLDALQLMTH